MGYVYVLVNKCFPGYVKIGRTKNDPQYRAKQLSTGVPIPFEVAYFLPVDNPSALESLIHRELADYRVSKSSEFFKLTGEEARELIEKIACECLHGNRYDYERSDWDASLLEMEVW